MIEKQAANGSTDTAPEWTPDLDNILTGGQPPEDTPSPQEEGKESAGSETPDSDDLEGQLEWFKKQFGKSQNELGEWRRKAEALEKRMEALEGNLAKSSEPETFDEKENFEKFMRAVDPNWEDLSEAITGYADDKKPLYNAALLLFGEIAKVRAELQQTLQKQQEGQILAQAGIGPEVVQKMTGNPVLAPLWENASAEQKIEMAKAFGNTAGGNGEGPSGQGPSSQPSPTRSHMIESASTTPGGRAAGVAGNLEQRVHAALEKGDLDSARKFVDKLLDQQLSTARGWAR